MDAQLGRWGGRGGWVGVRGGGARRDLWTTTKLPDYAETDTVVALLQVSRLVTTKRATKYLSWHPSVAAFPCRLSTAGNDPRRRRQSMITSFDSEIAALNQALSSAQVRPPKCVPTRGLPCRAAPGPTRALLSSC